MNLIEFAIPDSTFSSVILQGFALNYFRMHQQRWNLFVIWLLFSLNLEFRLNGFLLLYEDPLEEEGFVIW